jgi:predicted transglutaminase-like cysteine proteinase
MSNHNTIVRMGAAALAAIGLWLAAASGAAAGSTAFVGESGSTSMPIGHAQFCAERPDECLPNDHVVAAFELTELRWRQLLEVNAEINGSVVPVTDAVLYQVEEYWTYPHGYGDCEDFVLAKRRALIDLGWPASTLLVTVVREANGDGHAVLTVRTDRGDLVLDNQDGMIRLWSETPYTYIKRQSQVSSGAWVDLVDSRAVSTVAGIGE